MFIACDITRTHNAIITSSTLSLLLSDVPQFSVPCYKLGSAAVFHDWINEKDINN